MNTDETREEGFKWKQGKPFRQAAGPGSSPAPSRSCANPSSLWHVVCHGGVVCAPLVGHAFDFGATQGILEAFHCDDVIHNIYARLSILMNAIRATSEVSSGCGLQHFSEWRSEWIGAPSVGKHPSKRNIYCACGHQVPLRWCQRRGQGYDGRACPWVRVCTYSGEL